MRKILAIVGLATSLLLMSGCDRTEEDKQRDHEIRMAKIQSGQDLAEGQMHHERQMAYSVPRPIAPIGMGTYVDYRGNLQYGNWDAWGNWRWHDQDSMYATQTRSYLDYQVATGVLTATAIGIALSRDSWDRDHRDGWQSRPVVVKNYTSSDGKSISKNEYKKRQAVAQKKRGTWKKDKSTYQAKNKSSYASKTKANKTTATKTRPDANKSAVSLKRSDKQLANKVSSKSHVNRRLTGTTASAQKKPLLTRKPTKQTSAYKAPQKNTYKAKSSYKSPTKRRSSSSSTSSKRRY